ncbi:MAG TPA: S41 family peptidase [Chitinophagaceae bacterium]|nr:S41 family peptidase [Chitinophagaceae bacterium]
MKKILYYIYKRRLPALLIGLAAFIYSSCRKEISSVNQTGNTPTGNFSQVFEDFWTNMNNNYVFWDVDSTNWDNVNTIYAPKFSSLNLYDSADNIKAIGYFKEMVDGLTDSHFTLFPGGGYIQPAHDRKLKNPQFVENMFGTAPYSPSVDGYFYYTNALDSLYLGEKVVGVDTTGSIKDMYAVSGIISSTNILYLSFSKFALVSAYQGASPKIKAVLDYFFNKLSSNTITGLIVDVRGNIGGDISDLNFLVGSLISSPLQIGYTKSKSGTGRLDYTPWAPAVVTPRPGATAFTKPIVVLADGESVSMAELTTMALKRLSNTTVVGDTTWGANGPLTSNDVYNAGSFNFGNVYTNIETGATSYYGNAYTSSTQFKYIDGKVYEGKGFPPDVDIKQTLNTVFLRNNYIDDPQLDKAITLLQ